MNLENSRKHLEDLKFEEQKMVAREEMERMRSGKVFQPYTTDATPAGLVVARNTMRLRLADMAVSDTHRWLCHPGRECADGCDAAPIPERLALIQSDHEPQ